jgi:hypothetical protein
MIHAANGDDDSQDFEKRVASKRVDLIKRITEGLPPVEYLPESDGMLVKGKRHLIVAPRKTGKSLGMLVHWVRMALAGSRIVIFDRENGGDEYARRLGAIITAWDLQRRDTTRLKHNLRYYEFPRLKSTDGPRLADLAEGAHAVVFDSQRLFLSDLGLSESESDDYADFMRFAIEPLFRAGIATVILDNTGHSNQSRSRGSSAKGDLNEVLFTIEVDDDFSRDRQGKLRLKLGPGNSRFGNEGEWVMRIGGGAFEHWKLVGEDHPVDPAFREVAIAALAVAGTNGLSQTKLLAEIRDKGVQFRGERGRDWLYQLAADPSAPVHMVSSDGPGLPIMFYGDPS